MLNSEDYDLNLWDPELMASQQERERRSLSPGGGDGDGGRAGRRLGDLVLYYSGSSDDDESGDEHNKSQSQFNPKSVSTQYTVSPNPTKVSPNPTHSQSQPNQGQSQPNPGQSQPNPKSVSTQPRSVPTQSKVSINPTQSVSTQPRSVPTQPRSVPTQPRSVSTQPQVSYNTTQSFSTQPNPTQVSLNSTWVRLHSFVQILVVSRAKFRLKQGRSCVDLRQVILKLWLFPEKESESASLDLRLDASDSEMTSSQRNPGATPDSRNAASDLGSSTSSLTSSRPETESAGFGVSGSEEEEEVEVIFPRKASSEPRAPSSDHHVTLTLPSPPPGGSTFPTEDDILDVTDVRSPDVTYRDVMSSHSELDVVSPTRPSRGVELIDITSPVSLKPHVTRTRDLELSGTDLENLNPYARYRDARFGDMSTPQDRDALDRDTLLGDACFRRGTQHGDVPSSQDSDLTVEYQPSQESVRSDSQDVVCLGDVSRESLDVSAGSGDVSRGDESRRPQGRGDVSGEGGDVSLDVSRDSDDELDTTGETVDSSRGEPKLIDLTESEDEDMRSEGAGGGAGVSGGRGARGGTAVTRALGTDADGPGGEESGDQAAGEESDIPCIVLDDSQNSD